MKKTIALLAAVITLGFAGTPVIAAVTAAEAAPVYTKNDNLAVGGWDVVSYFTGTPVKGSAEFETTYKGAIWRFSSAENLAAFTADPASYEPQYGGYCAWGVAKGGLYKGDPKAWTIVDGKLYLNYNKSVQKKWEKNIPENLEKSEANWPGLVK